MLHLRPHHRASPVLNSRCDWSNAHPATARWPTTHGLSDYTANTVRNFFENLSRQTYFASTFQGRLVSGSYGPAAQPPSELKTMFADLQWVFIAGQHYWVIADVGRYYGGPAPGNDWWECDRDPGYFYLENLDKDSDHTDWVVPDKRRKTLWRRTLTTDNLAAVLVDNEDPLVAIYAAHFFPRAAEWVAGLLEFFAFGAKYRICASAGPHGAIAPSGCAYIPWGSDVTFSAEADTGYAVDQWILDGSVAQTGGSGHTLVDVDASHTLEVTFGPIDYGELTIERPAADPYRTGESSTMFSGKAPSNTVYVTWTNLETGITEPTDDPPGTDWQDRVYLTGGDNHVVIKAYDSSNRLIAKASKLVIKIDIPPPITLDSTEECFVGSARPSHNYGDGIVYIGFDAVEAGKERALVKFNLSSIPAGSTVLSAQFGARNLPHYSSGGPISVTLYRATGNWSEASVTWNSKPGYSTSGSDATAVLPNDDWVYWDASGIVAMWVNQGYANYGSYLITDVENSLVTTERVFNDDYFRLSIEYEVETVPPSVVIVQPTVGDTYCGDSASVTLSGTAFDNFGVSGVSCLNQSTGASMNASGTSAWTCTIALEPGLNQIVVVARDSAQNTGTDSIDVEYLVPPANVVASDGLAGVVWVEWGAVVGTSHYRVHRAVSSDGTKETLSGWQAGLSYPDTPPQSDRGYWYWVTAAADSGGTCGTAFGGPDTGFFRTACGGHAECQNGLFCDGGEICDASGCIDGLDPCIDLAHCDEGSDICICLNDTECDDGFFCNGAETCDPSGLCQRGASPCPDDGVPCTADTCDEGANVCRYDLAPGTCLIAGSCYLSRNAE